MIDLKKSSDGGELIRDELRTLSTTSCQIKDEIDTVRHKLNGELDLLTLRLDRLEYETQEIRRDVHEINQSIDKLRYELFEVMRHGKSDSRELIWNLFPIIAIVAPMIAVAILIIIAVLAG